MTTGFPIFFLLVPKDCRKDDGRIWGAEELAGWVYDMKEVRLTDRTTGLCICSLRNGRGDAHKMSGGGADFVY